MKQRLTDTVLRTLKIQARGLQTTPEKNIYEMASHTRKEGITWKPAPWAGTVLGETALEFIYSNTSPSWVLLSTFCI